MERKENISISFNPGILDLVFILNSSSNISLDDESSCKEFICDIVSFFDLNSETVRVAVITHDNNAIIQIDWNQYKTKESLINAVIYLDLRNDGGATFTADALNLVNTKLSSSRHNAAKVVVLITDGVSQDILNAIRAGKNLRASHNVTVVSVGVGDLVNEFELHGIASDTERVYLVSGYDQIYAIKDAIIMATSIKPENVARYKKSTVIDYWQEPLDLVFVLNTPCSMSSEDKELCKEFVKDIIYSFDIDSGTIRVAVISYATTARVQVDWKQCLSRSALRTTLLQMDLDQNGSDNNIAEALNLATTHLLSRSRSNVPKMVVLITDGKSQDKYCTARAAYNLKGSHKATVMSIGVGDYVMEEELKTIASDDSLVICVSGYDQIDAVLGEIVHTALYANPNVNKPSGSLTGLLSVEPDAL